MQRAMATLPLLRVSTFVGRRSILRSSLPAYKEYNAWGSWSACYLAKTFKTSSFIDCVVYLVINVSALAELLGGLNNYGRFGLGNPTRHFTKDATQHQ